MFYKQGYAFDLTPPRLSSPDVYVRLVLQEKERALAVLPLYGHVQQRLPVRHGVVDARPGAQQLGCDRVHACEISKPWLMHFPSSPASYCNKHTLSTSQSRQFLNWILQA